MDLKDYMTCVFLLWFANAGIATPVRVGCDNGLQPTVFPAVFSARVMVTATWRADHLRHEMITRRVVGDDHVRGDWWLIRQGNARKKWHRHATLFGPCPTRTLLVYI
ncbi:hypothetical protein NC653_006201 [Populus alba x Populus x berolinensis]|uniref:Secreted protein n=1 Tax=Populus alba x Populus x berolinensis TaxID=444605 RepID=A0AAD6RE45_9ROSI|nr:hypothetical protein NC653_006201 [Populus alba x Populus x berolinensis]